MLSSRTRSKLSGPGPYLAEITNHLDKTFMGGLEVILLSNTPGDIKKQSDTYAVKYLSPFYGVTSARFQGNDSSKYSDTQKSYGMWMVPPDVGTTVMVIFVNSDPNQGYWIGCVPDTFQNHMIPGIAASPTALVSPAEKSKYLDAPALPVAEYNKKVFGKNEYDPEGIGKPVHPFADILLNQGLLLDNVRGVTTSGARRERPSSVFGISTPGPLDPDGPRAAFGYDTASKTTPVSRLGGTTFVMDDGDVNGENELVRIRTRTGHQILLHNTKDLIYIANSRGTAWLEFTSDGKIDIYAADSVSIHTEGDFNLKADRDFNLDAGRNFNILAREAVNINSSNSINLMTTDVNASAIGNYSLSVGADSNIRITGNSSNDIGNQISMTSKNMVFTATEIISLLGKQSIEIDSDLTKLFPKASSIKSISPTLTDPVGINIFSVPGTMTNDKSATPGLVAAMQRVPMHEPWIHHEDASPGIFSLNNTDALSNVTTGVTTSSSGITVSAPSLIVKTKPGVDAGMIRRVKTPWTTDQTFLNKVKAVASALKIPPIDLIAAMNLETIRSFDPAARNPISGATGLIQFMSFTIASLSGGQVDKYLRVIKEGSENLASLSYMSRIQQMDWVEKYFRAHNWPTSQVASPSLVNVYLTIFLPAYAFKPSDYVLARRGTLTYSQNPGFQRPGRDYFTVGDIAASIEHHKIDAIATLRNNGIGSDLEPLPK
jgi:hypothetical protein